MKRNGDRCRLLVTPIAVLGVSRFFLFSSVANRCNFAPMCQFNARFRVEVTKTPKCL